MAIFIGTKEEFKRYFDGYCKIQANTLAKPERLACNNTCQYCGKTNTELDSAHIDGRERKTIIENILDTHFKVDNNKYEVNLEKFKQLFIEEQSPVEKHFFFLCKDCHKKYDRKEITTEEIKQIEIKKAEALLELLLQSVNK